MYVVCVCVHVCVCVYACVKAMLPLYTHKDMHGMYMYNGHLTSQIVLTSLVYTNSPSIIS